VQGWMANVQRVVHLSFRETLKRIAARRKERMVALPLPDAPERVSGPTAAIGGFPTETFPSRNGSTARIAHFSDVTGG
jgi:hypothetical protein